MIFNRRVVEAALRFGMQPASDDAMHLAFAIPDHPWVDSAAGANVRISMTVVEAGAGVGRLLTSKSEIEGNDGELLVEFETRTGKLHADLKLGANVASVKPLKSNSKLSNRGLIPHGVGFIVTPLQAASLGLGTVPGLERHIRPYRNGRDLTDRPRGVLVIDPLGLSADEMRRRFPAVFQWLLERVKPERDQVRRKSIRDNWWLHAWSRGEFRPALDGIPRYIATGQVSKHRIFQWVERIVLPDDKLIAIASDDALHLGILSSSVHSQWALAAGGRLGVGNDPVYSKSTCFEPFPFPDEDTGLTTELACRIRELAEQIDAHRKERQAAYEVVTLTGMYNVLDKLRSGEVLTDKDRLIHEQGLVNVLRTLHDDLDACVLAAYGWSDLELPSNEGAAARDVSADRTLERLVALNRKRSAEEAGGAVRWLRPAFQQQQSGSGQTPLDIAPQEDDQGLPAPTLETSALAAPKRAWPVGLPEQIKAVAEVLGATVRPMTLADVEARFSARGRWRDRLPTILDTLEALGRVRVVGGDAEAWQGR